MKLWLFVAFLVVPLVEFWIVLQVADRVGLLPTIAILIIDSLLGAYLVKREGSGAWRRIRESLSQAKAPTDSVIDGVLIVAAGALMLTPGFLTDVVGFALLLPPSRVPVRSMLKKRFAGSLGLSGTGPGGAFINAQVFGDAASGGSGAHGPSGPGGPGGPSAGGRVPFGFGRNMGDVIDGDVVDEGGGQPGPGAGSRTPPPNGGRRPFGETGNSGGPGNGATAGDIIDAESWEEPPDHPRLGS